MTQSLEFSIVIPTYNSLKFLQQALGSVWTQTRDDYEVIVVDDGSTDGTGKYLTGLGERIKSIHQPNRGPAAARNKGVKHAEGEYVAFLDSDDFWFPWTLATFHKVIHDHDRPPLISAAMSEFEGEMPKVAQENLTTESFRDYFATADNPAYVGSNALVVKRSVFNQANGFDESMFVGEDLDFFLRVGAAGSFVRVLTPVTLGYRRHGRNISRVPLALHSAALDLLNREVEDRYPGGKARKRERWQLLSRAVRPVALVCLRAGLRKQAWSIYRKTFRMNLRLGRLRFLAGFPIYGLHALVLGRRGPDQLPQRHMQPGLDDPKRSDD